LQKVASSKWMILAAVMIPVLMGPIDSSVVYVAFPSLSEVFNVSPDTVGWVSISYLLVLASFQLSFGRLGDMFGFKRIFLAGNVVFTLASFLCGMSWSIGWLIAFRSIQAIGAGMTSSLAPAIITAIFPPQERGKALGMIGMVVALGLATGPSLGGLLLDLWGWRTIFFINIPIGIRAHLAGHRVLPEKKELLEQKFDWMGAWLALVTLSALLFFISRGQHYQWSGFIVLVGILAVTAAVLFVLQERKIPEPMLELALFRSRAFSSGNIATLFHFMTQYIIIFITPFYLQQQLGLPPSTVGVTMTAFPLTVLLVAPVSGTLSDKIGNRLLSSAGAIFCALGALSLAMVGPDLSPADVTWRLSLFGLGTGMFQSPTNSAIMGAVAKNRLGIAGGVLATTRNVGMVLGIAIGSLVLSARQAVYLLTGAPLPGLLAMQDAYITAAVLSAFCFVSCLFVKDRQEAASTQHV
jgi:EmrB/QacA subfamily drug resistance transporter